jgi:thioesterase domain-containing protein
LEQEGEQVAFVALLDARDVFLPPMNQTRRMLVRSWRFAQRLLFFAANIRRRGINLLRQQAAGSGWMSPQAGEKDVVIPALRYYQPKPWSGRILHLWAAERPKGVFRSPEFICRHLSPGGFIFHEVPGDHLSMLHEPNVGKVAEILAAELDSL